MKFKVVGLEKFTSKKGKDITKIYSVFQSDRISGLGCQTFFILSSNVPSDISVDSYFVPYYGPQGSNGFLAGVNIVQ